MAKRKSKLLLSDLLPELAAATEREEEVEEEEPARKVRKVDKNGRRLPEHMQPGPSAAQQEKWNGRLEVAKQWKRTKGRFPKANKKDKEETSLYDWLNNCRPGKQNWSQERWEKLNEAFSEGWEKECFPYLESGTWAGQPGHQIRNSANTRDEAHWDAILDAVKEFKRIHGRFPRRRGGDADEVKLYKWLHKCSDRTMSNWTQDRADKLVLAFGDRWQSECFPRTIYFW
jgi:hypothetical protein